MANSFWRVDALLLGTARLGLDRPRGPYRSDANAPTLAGYDRLRRGRPALIAFSSATSTVLLVESRETKQEEHAR
jgi:hypothetical protein